MSRATASLGRRLVLGAAVFIVLALIVAGIVIGFVLHRFVRGQIDQRLDGQILTIAAALQTGPDGLAAIDHDIDGPPFDRPLSGWYWEVAGLDPALKSRSLGTASLDVPERPDWPPPWDARPAVADMDGPSGEPLRVRLQRKRIGDTTVTIMASAPRAAIYGPLREALATLAVALAVLGAGLVVAILVQVRLGLRPLARLRLALADVRAGRLHRVPQDQPLEVLPLVSELNGLLDENEAGLARARRHVANLAHGLKTPLATLALGLDEEGRDPGGEFRMLASMMERRIRHHLARARAAALNGPARVRTPVGARIADLAAVLPKIHATKPVRLELAVPGDIAVACEPQDLDEMLGNLLDNAYKWCGGTVQVCVSTEGASVMISVDDDGPGLAEDAIPDALRPGRRLDESAPGYGFGLPIASELAELYGGGLVLCRSTLGGLGARLSLPGVPPASRDG